MAPPTEPIVAAAMTATRPKSPRLALNPANGNATSLGRNGRIVSIARTSPTPTRPIEPMMSATRPARPESGTLDASVARAVSKVTGMSVSARLNPYALVGGLVGVALVAGAFAYADDDGDPLVRAAPSATRVHSPTKSLDVIPSATPARSALGVSRRLFDSSPVAVLADRRDRRAQRVAITSATTLGVPVLLDDRGAPAELT